MKIGKSFLYWFLFFYFFYKSELAPKILRFSGHLSPFTIWIQFTENVHKYLVMDCVFLAIILSLCPLFIKIKEKYVDYVFDL